MSRKSSLSIEKLKKGKRTYGAFYTNAAGVTFYMAWRNSAHRTKGIFQSGERDVSAAIRAGNACWALDEDLLIDLRARGIKHVGVLDSATGDKYMTLLSYFFDTTKASVKNYAGRGGALQRYLPLQHFRRQVGKAKI